MNRIMENTKGWLKRKGYSFEEKTWIVEKEKFPSFFVDCAKWENGIIVGVDPEKATPIINYARKRDMNIRLCGFYRGECVHVWVG